MRVAPEERSSPWYPGAGIYRNVWLDVTGPVHVARWGTYITTPEVTPGRATVAVRHVSSDCTVANGPAGDEALALD